MTQATATEWDFGGDRPAVRFCPKRPLVRLGLALAAALIANGVGMLAPRLVPSLSLGAAQAQTTGSFSDAQVRSYATAVLDIDSSREAALATVRTMLEGAGLSTNQVDLSCTSIRSLNRLPGSIRTDVRETMVGFCNQAGSIVVDSGLSVNQFNAMTAAHQADPQLADRITEAIIQIKAQQQR